MEMSFQSSLMPSALLSDGIQLVPLFAVTQMSLTESYHLPPIGSKGARAVVATHDDTITLNGVLIGATRFVHKELLETLAESGRRGGALAALTKGAVSGLILVTSMTIRLDMQVQTLTFNMNATRRDVIDVNISMVHLPRPSALGKLLDLASIGVGALADVGGH